MAEGGDPAGRAGDLVAMIARKLKADILGGSLKPGDRVRDSVVAAELGVSRAPVREALRLLERSGLVVKTPNKSYVVTLFTQKDISELSSLRLSLETLAARLAFGTPRLAAGLKTALADMASAVAANDAVGAMRADREFHDALVDAAGHRRLADAYSIVSDQIEVAYIEYYRSSPDMSQLIPEHARLLRLASEGSVEEFIAALTLHVVEGRRRHINFA